MVKLIKRYWNIIRRPSVHFSLGFLTVGGFIGVATAFAKKALRAGVEDPDLIEKHTNIPVYATVPHSKRQDRIFKALLDAAVETGLGIRAVCEEFARQQQWRAEARTRSNILSVFNALGLNMHRRGFVPGFVVRWYARGYFRRRLRLGLPSGSGRSS